MIDWTPEHFLAQMTEQKIHRAFLVYINGEIKLSHPELLNPMRDFLEGSPDFARHEAIFIGREDNIGTLFFACVHDTHRGLSQGGLRFWKYGTMNELLTDGLRLSQGMTRKNALAGLWWGGGKGIMQLPSSYKFPWDLTNQVERRQYFEAYGRFVASLHGVYYTAEDVGTSTQDTATILSQNRFVTCIPSEVGGSGNPSPFTAIGVFRGMQAAWKFLKGTDSLKGVRVAVQGAGHVGEPLIRLLYKDGAKVSVSEHPNKQKNLIALQQELSGIKIMSDPDAIYDAEADIFAPCAFGAVVNVDTIPRLKVKLVCGAANNILKEPEEDARRLQERGIAFVPDFVCNRMGIVNCADEWMGYLESDIRDAAEHVYPDTLEVFQYAKDHKLTTTEAADQLADAKATILHPLIGHRGQRIIQYLIESGWVNG
jgi:glutamate dehydrogenase/leucine dehydrogenase